MNKLQERSFGDDDFVTWYQSLNKNERKELWKEIEKRMTEGYEKSLQSLAEIKDIKLGSPYTFTVIYKTRRE